MYFTIYAIIHLFHLQELTLLGMLYGLFQKFITFDRKFRATLWSDVELVNASIEVYIEIATFTHLRKSLQYSIVIII